MQHGKLTIILKPEWGAQKRSSPLTVLTLTSRQLGCLGLMVILLIVFGVSGSWNIHDNIMLRRKTRDARQALHEQKAITAQVGVIKKNETIIREFLGLEPWDTNPDMDARLGMGGAEPSSGPVVAPVSAHREVAVGYTRPLHQRVLDLRDDVHELLGQLSKMTERLSCRPTIMPVQDNAIWISSGFGQRRNPFTDMREFHRGLDISGKRGTAIVATADGIVKDVGSNRFIGNYIRIEHDKRFATLYGHLQQQNVKKKQAVKRGQIIGTMGTTGMSTGYHLHYEVLDNGRKVNPYNYILNRHEVTLTASR